MDPEQIAVEKPIVFYDYLWPSMQTGHGIMFPCYRACDRESPREPTASTSLEESPRNV